jgi:putative drug exporter of the RND superfamily
MAAWDRVAAAVTHRRSWVIALLISLGAGVFMALAGPNTGADMAPQQLPTSAESARAAALLKTLPDEDRQPAILVASRRDHLRRVFLVLRFGTRSMGCAIPQRRELRSILCCK